ncbi:MAG: response regulator transcription factor [Anaerovoracaceae bacterium]
MKILVVEDEDGLREALEYTLKKEGYLVDTAARGDLGYDLMTTGLYDLVILDIMLPGMDGIEVLKKLRRNDDPTPVILLTARSELEDKITGIDSGADDYITKPFAMPELLARIRMVSRRRGNDKAPDMSIHGRDIFLNTATFELCSDENGRTIKLTAKEYQIMEFLMRNTGQILSREQITEKVWGYDSEAEYNNVDVYISFLRKKMAFVGTDAKIRAVRGVGYEFQEDGSRN